MSTKNRKTLLIIAIGLMLLSSVNDVFAQGNKNNLNVFVQTDHTETPNFMVLSPDRSILCTVGTNTDVRLWDTNSGLLIKTIRIKKDFMVFAAALSPDNRLLATGGGDDTLNVWDVMTGKPAFTVPGGKESITSIVFTKKGKKIIFGNDDGYLRVCDVKKKTIIKKKAMISAPRSIAVLPNNKNVLVGLYAGNILEFSLKDFELTALIPGHNNVVSDISVHPDGDKIITVGMDNRAFLLMRKNNMWHEVKCYKALPPSKTKLMYLAGFYSSGFNKDGSRFAFAGNDELIRVCDTPTGNILKKFRAPSAVKSIAFSAPGKLSVIRFQSKAIMDYDIKTGKKFKKFGGNAVSVESLAASKNLLITINKNETGAIWRLPECSLVRSFKSPYRGSYQSPGLVSFAKNGQIYALINDTKAEIINAKTHKIIKVIDFNAYQLCSLTLSPDGRYLAAKTSQDTLLWDLTANKEILHIMYSFNLSNITPIFSPDSKTMVFGDSDSKMQIYDLEHRRNKKIIDNGSDITSMCFSPDNRYIATGCLINDIKIWDAVNGSLLKTLSGHKGMLFGDIAWSPDGKTLASSNPQGELFLWDTTSWTMKKSIKTHIGSVNALAFTSDSHYVISGGADGSVRLHDIASFKNTVSLFSLPEGDWAAITTQGYYNASDKGGDYINANSGLQVSRIDSYAATYFRPDMVKFIVAGKDTGSFKSAGAEATPPTCLFVNTATSSKTDMITAFLKTMDTGGGIGKTVLYLNGSAVRSHKGRGIKVVKKGKEFIRKYEIKLNPGVNTLKAVTFNKTNSIEGNPAEITIKCLAQKPQGTKIYGLVIGIDQYRNPKLQLRYAAKDAHLFAQTLRKNTKKLFTGVKLEVLTTPEKTGKKAILAALEKYKNLSPNDLFVFYVAAHGVIDEGEFYLLSSNVGHLSSKKLKKDALSQSALKELVSNIPTSKKIIVLDTCNSQALGNAFETAFLTRGLNESTAVKLLGRSTGSTIMSASKTGQEAIEGYKNHGLFTYTIARGLEGMADLNNDGYVKTTELADYVEENVTELSETIFKKAQFPVVSRNGQSFPITSK